MTATRTPAPSDYQHPSKNHTAVKAECRKWLEKNNPGMLWWGVPSGKFGRSGMPDVYCTGLSTGPHRSFWLEIKTGRGVLSGLQYERIEALRAAGDVVFVVHSLGELKGALGIV